MKLADKPRKIELPWAGRGNKNVVPVSSPSGTASGAASYEDGFPPLTMTPIAAGGIPPSGLDMNGVLHDATAQARWSQAGAGSEFDVNFAESSDVGGYPKGARVLRSDGTGYWISQSDDNTTNPESGYSDAWAAAEQPGSTRITLGGQNHWLEPLEYGRKNIILSGELSTDVRLFFPEGLEGTWNVINITTGGYNVKATTGNGRDALLGLCTVIQSDGKDFYAVEGGSGGGSGGGSTTLPSGDDVVVIPPHAGVPAFTAQNLEELKTVEPRDDLIVSTLGYYTPGDPGGGTYLPITDWLSFFGKNVAADNAKYVKWSGGENKGWMLLGEPNACQWGIVPDPWRDGRDDDGKINADRLQEAFVRSGELYFHKVGRYFFGSNGIIWSGQVIRGVTSGSIYRNDTGVFLDFYREGHINPEGSLSFSFDGTTNPPSIVGVKISNVKIRAKVSLSSGGSYVQGLSFEDVHFIGRVVAEDCVLSGVSFLRCTFQSLNWVGKDRASFQHTVGGPLAAQGNVSQDVTFDRCIFAGGTVGISFAVNANGGNLNTVNCQFGDYTQVCVKTNHGTQYADFGSTFQASDSNVMFVGDLNKYIIHGTKGFYGSLFWQATQAAIWIDLAGVGGASIQYPMEISGVRCIGKLIKGSWSGQCNLVGARYSQSCSDFDGVLNASAIDPNVSISSY